MRSRHSDLSLDQNNSFSLCRRFINGNNVFDHLDFLREKGRVLRAAAASPSAASPTVRERLNSGSTWCEVDELVNEWSRTSSHSLGT